MERQRPISTGLFILMLIGAILMLVLTVARFFFEIPIRRTSWVWLAAVAVYFGWESYGHRDERWSVVALTAANVALGVLVANGLAPSALPDTVLNIGFVASMLPFLFYLWFALINGDELADEDIPER